MMETSEI